MKINQQLIESTIRQVLREYVDKKNVRKPLNENLPPGAEYWSDAPWNDDTVYDTQTAVGFAEYYNEELDDYKSIDFKVEIDVPGRYIKDEDEDGPYAVFEPQEGVDYESLVYEVKDFPDTIDGGFTFDHIEVEDVY